MNVKLYGFDIANKYVKIPGFVPKPAARAISAAAAVAVLVTSFIILKDIFNVLKTSYVVLTTQGNANKLNKPPKENFILRTHNILKKDDENNIMINLKSALLLFGNIIVWYPIARNSFPLINSIMGRITPLTLS